MAAPVYYSADMVRALPEDGNRYETVHGELLVTPAPNAWHQVVVKRLITALERYLTAHPVGEALMSPADISWSPGTLVQPDVFVVDRHEAKTLDWKQYKTLLVAVEVLSPSTARYDRFTKRRLYQEVGVPVYWLVEPNQGLVEVWSPDTEFPEIERERVVWNPDGADSPLAIDLVELFEPI